MSDLAARGLKVEELRLADRAAATDARAAEVTRRERELLAQQETSLAAARHTARQTVAFQEEACAAERQFIAKEAVALSGERTACQEQVSTHHSIVYCISILCSHFYVLLKLMWLQLRLAG
jgi:hypothetical protein